MIYFIQCDHSGPVKIGKSTNPQNRLKSLQCACPYKLHLIKILHGDSDIYVHKLLKDYRRTGEWFEPHPDVLSFNQKDLDKKQTKRKRFNGSLGFPRTHSLIYDTRKLSGLSLLEAANKWGLSESMLSLLERGLRNPGALTCIKLEKASGGLISKKLLRPDIFDE